MAIGNYVVIIGHLMHRHGDIHSPCYLLMMCWINWGNQCGLLLRIFDPSFGRSPEDIKNPGIINKSRFCEWNVVPSKLKNVIDFFHG